MSYTAPPNWIAQRPPTATAPGYPASIVFPHVGNGERSGHKAPPPWPHPPPPAGTAVPGFGNWPAAGYPQWPSKPPVKPGSAEYWATELKDNGLQLQGIEPTKCVFTALSRSHVWLIGFLPIVFSLFTHQASASAISCGER